MYRKEIIEGCGVSFNPVVKANEDGLFNLVYMRHSPEVRVIEKPYVYVYRQWKKKGKEGLCKNPEFDSADAEIASIVRSFDDAGVYEEQMVRRKASIAFWNAARVSGSDAGFVESRGYLKLLFSDAEVRDALGHLDYAGMNIYKRTVASMIRRKHYTALCLSLKYVRPMLESVAKR